MSSVAVYSDTRILKEIKDGHIIIEPFREEQLGNCSYNLTLSEHFFREVVPPFDPRTGRYKQTFLNPWCEEHVGRTWKPGMIEVATVEMAPRLGLKAGDKYISLIPMETVLVASEEFVGTREHITGMIKGRSSAGRSILSVCDGSGWGDVGYVNRWALLLTNKSPYRTIILPLGCSIAQIVFLECGHPRKSYTGKYQTVDTKGLSAQQLIEDLKKTWTPSVILPQAYKDFPPEVILPSSDITTDPSEETSEEESEDEWTPLPSPPLATFTDSWIPPNLPTPGWSDIPEEAPSQLQHPSDVTTRDDDHYFPSKTEIINGYYENVSPQTEITSSYQSIQEESLIDLSNPPLTHDEPLELARNE